MPAELTERLGKLDAAIHEAPTASRKRRRWWPLFAIVLLGTLGAGAYFYVRHQADETPRNLEFQTLDRGTLVFAIVEKGELEAARNTEVICRVRASGRGNSIASTIKWVIDDGSRVKRGDLLMQLDDAGIKEAIKNQEIVIAGARDSKIQAESNLEIQKSENESALKTAQNNVEIARLDLEKYIKGELEQKRKDVMGRITLKESELLQSRDRMGWSNRMVKKGYISESQARGDELKMRSSEIDLDKLQEESRVLNDYDAQRNKIDFQNKLDQAIVAEKVARTSAVAKEAQMMAKLQSATAVLNQEENKLEDLLEDVRNCRIVAPNDGMVVYYIPDSARFGQSTQQGNIALGENVREGQKLMRIPDLSRMLARVKIHESLIPRLRGDVMQDTGFSEMSEAIPFVGVPGLDKIVRLLWYPRYMEHYFELDEEIAEPGLWASIKVASLEKPLVGHLKMVSPVASSTDWMSSDVKVYQCLVSIDEGVENLKPGMSAEVTIKVDERSDVLKLPVQAVLEIAGKKVCYVQDASGMITKRNINVGMNNTRFVELLTASEVKEGERVLLNARGYAEKTGELQNFVTDPNEALLGKQKKGRGLRGKGTAGENGNGNGHPTATSTAPQASKPLGSRPGGTRPGGAVTPEQERQRKEFNDKIQKASPADRKKLIDSLPIPDEGKAGIRERYRSQGLKIDD